MKEMVHTDPVLGEVTLRKSLRSRGISIRVHPERGILVTIPVYQRFTKGIEVLEARREWALKALERARKRDATLPEGETVETLRARAKAELPGRLKELADRYGFQYNRVIIKHNTSNWGSCSTKGNINLNLNLMRLPRPLQDYVLLHELTHLRHPDHGAAFHAELERLLGDHFFRFAEESDFRTFLTEASSSRAEYRITRVLEKALKAYRPV